MAIRGQWALVSLLALIGFSAHAANDSLLGKYEGILTLPNGRDIGIRIIITSVDADGKNLKGSVVHIGTRCTTPAPINGVVVGQDVSFISEELPDCRERNFNLQRSGNELSGKMVNFIGEYRVHVGKAATSDTPATNIKGKFDYQKLVGSWEWTYPIGYSTLTIETVSLAGEKVYASGSFDVSSQDTTVRGRKVIGTVNLQGEAGNIVFKGFGTLDLWWNGGGYLWGSCMFRTWTGDCEFSKK